MKKKNATKRIYGAYGSNLNLAQMHWRCLNARPLKVGTVNGYSLTFRRNGYANIEPEEGGRVPVLLWEVTETDEAALDRYEGYPKFYTKVDLPVETGDGTVTAMFYVMTERYAVRATRPTEWYLQTLREGYRDNDLPLEYLETQVNKALIEETKTNRFH